MLRCCNRIPAEVHQFALAKNPTDSFLYFWRELTSLPSQHLLCASAKDLQKVIFACFISEEFNPIPSYETTAPATVWMRSHEHQPEDNHLHAQIQVQTGVWYQKITEQL